VLYGGNTACIEISIQGTRLIFDAGTGLRVLGEHLRHLPAVEAHLFFTHTQWDRIQGFPFFTPAFDPKNCFHIYGATGLNGASIKQRLSSQMLRPNFSVPLQVMQANLCFHNINAGHLLQIGDITVETISLSRSNGALGYRVSWNGHSVVYATDTDHTLDSPDEGMLYLAQNADVLIFDTAYEDHTYYDSSSCSASRNPKVWKASIEAAFSTNVKQIVMFHHDPTHDDQFLTKVEREMQDVYPNVSMAREGMTIHVKG
ncbi:MAG: MBL fold metallo-hydrolase, partial [Elainellaceae cyanobacterium]